MSLELGPAAHQADSYPTGQQLHPNSHTVKFTYKIILLNVVCCLFLLQEVETDQFYNLFLPELKADGYDGIFSPKSRARTMSEQERKHVDGCAIFFRVTK